MPKPSLLRWIFTVVVFTALTVHVTIEVLHKLKRHASSVYAFEIFPKTNDTDIQVSTRPSGYQCIQSALLDEMGYYQRRGDEIMFRKGCNYAPVLDFESWALGTGCTKVPVVGPVIVHVAWMGPWQSAFQRDIEALLDSFLVTQEPSARLIFWFLEDRALQSPGTTELRNVYANYTNIEFIQANLTLLALDTCIANSSTATKLCECNVIESKHSCCCMQTVNGNGTGAATWSLFKKCLFRVVCRTQPMAYLRHQGIHAVASLFKPSRMCFDSWSYTSLGACGWTLTRFFCEAFDRLSNGAANSVANLQ
eukprot:m.228932 g.228932  ORF g.228932 m.228932 type:complete len:308 (-) comp19250_c1_seq55:5093-6016(-)